MWKYMISDQHLYKQNPICLKKYYVNSIWNSMKNYIMFFFLEKSKDWLKKVHCVFLYRKSKSSTRSQEMYILILNPSVIKDINLGQAVMQANSAHVNK